MEKLVIAIVALVLGAAMGAAWIAAEVRDEEKVDWAECVPVYYSGLECCK
jgi:hypothetical protein